MTIRCEQWGTVGTTAVELYTLTNACGMEVSIATYGGVITRLTAPDRDGQMADVVLGYDSLEQYVDDEAFLGCIVGRVANRISGAQFTLDGVVYDVDRNHGQHQLHGGSGGFHTRVWKGESLETAEGPQVILTYQSRDGEQGFPGTLDVTVVYTLVEDGVRIEYSAETDKPTVVCLSNHSYFNLAGHGAGDCLDHALTIAASRYLATDSEQIPTGELVSVAGSPLDFTGPATIGSRIHTDCEPLNIGQGYDHYFVFDEKTSLQRPAARVYEPVYGRVLEVLTDQPGVQFYSGNHLNGDGKDGATYGRRAGFCLETQGYLDSPNMAEFPSVRLEPGSIYRHKTTYQFLVK